MATVDEIDDLLPQTQCTRCGYNGCRPYAQAIASDLAPINQCPPGGTATIAALAALLHREPTPLNPVHGVEGPALVAVIDEERCIGCVKCLAPCPVDAIIGARRHMHTVVAELCTGCELCIAPCPVDCIAMVAPEVAATRPARAAAAPDARQNRVRFHAHQARLERQSREQSELLAARKATAQVAAHPETDRGATRAGRQ